MNGQLKILENFSKQVLGEDGKRECRTDSAGEDLPWWIFPEGRKALTLCLSVQCSDFQMWVRRVTSDLGLQCWLKIQLSGTESKSEFHGMGLVSCSILESFKA